MAIQYFTKEGLENLKAELENLKGNGRREMSRQIAEAREKGDLSENAEYDAAKEAQGLLEAKINKLEEAYGNARLIDESKMDSSKVLILSNVKILNHKVKKEFTYTLVAEEEADLRNGKISVNSPIAKGLLGKVKGDVVEVKVPAGLMKLEILDISRR